MKDPRLTELAENLVNFSVNLQPGERILIDVSGDALPLAVELVKKSYAAGGIPFARLSHQTLSRELLKEAQTEQLQAMAEWDRTQMAEMQAYLGVRAGENTSEFADLPGEKLKLYNKEYIKPVHMEVRVPKTKWCVLRYPNASMAHLANMSIEGFEKFYFNVCNLDYSKMSKAMDPLVELMERTDRVRLTGKDTDLTFSIKGLPAVKCDGHMNIPDGEIFTAPVKDSVNGVITYNTPAVYEGFTYEEIRLEFRDGKIMKSSANDRERIERVFDTDEGARYVGEFALGVNPHILNPMKDTLFDEKINGSFHFTPGSCYDECNNGNKSAIHWDLVYIQRPEFGGGEIYFDDRLIRKEGRFVLPELEPLNPENLL